MPPEGNEPFPQILGRGGENSAGLQGKQALAQGEWRDADRETGVTAETDGRFENTGNPHKRCVLRVSGVFLRF